MRGTYKPLPVERRRYSPRPSLAILFWLLRICLIGGRELAFLPLSRPICEEWEDMGKGVRWVGRVWTAVWGETSLPFVVRTTQEAKNPFSVTLLCSPDGEG